MLAVKIAVSVLSLYVVSRSVAWRDVGVLLMQVSYPLLALALLIFWIAQCVSSLRCVYVARALGGTLDWGTSLRAHFVGLWFNQVLPTSLGGDIVKTAIISKPLGLNRAIRSAIFDRFSGLMFMLAAIIVTLPFYLSFFKDRGELVAFLGVFAAGGWLAVVVVAWCAHRAGESRIEGSLFRVPLRLALDLWAFRKGEPLWQQAWTSAIVHVNGIVTFFLIGRALGVGIDFVIFLLIVPVVFLVALIPLSFAGWGIREAGAVWLFGMAGISKESAVAMSVTYGLFLIGAAVPGVIYLNTPDRRSI